MLRLVLPLALLISCASVAPAPAPPPPSPTATHQVAPQRPRCDFGRAEGDAAEVSLAQVLENVSAHHGKRVRFRAVARLEFEHSLVYPTRLEYDDDLPRHALWFGWPRREWVLAERACGGREVMVVGTISARDHGHYGSFPRGSDRGADSRGRGCARWRADRAFAAVTPLARRTRRHVP